MVVRLDNKRSLTIPAGLMSTSPGDQFNATFDPDEGALILRRIQRNVDWLRIWKQCPVPMDDLPSRSREMPRKRKL